jgi:hypothetical protein
VKRLFATTPRNHNPRMHTQNALVHVACHPQQTVGLFTIAIEAVSSTLVPCSLRNSFAFRQSGRYNAIQTSAPLPE